MAKPFSHCNYYRIFGYYAGKVQLTYDFAKIIPADDPDYIDYIKFKNTFGEDGNVLVIGVQSDKIFEYNFLMIGVI